MMSRRRDAGARRTDDGAAHREVAPGRSALTSRHVERAASSQGERLPAPLRGSLEATLGTGLDGVRVHTGAASADAASALGANAYAVGQDIHFGAGSYDPASQDGQFLIAHEVAHTVQQRGGPPEIQCDRDDVGGGDAREAEADQVAEAAVDGAQAAVGVNGTALGIVEDQLAEDAASAEQLAAARREVGGQVDGYLAALGESLRAFSSWRRDQWIEFVRRTAPWCAVSAQISTLLDRVYRDALCPDLVGSGIGTAADLLVGRAEDAFVRLFQDALQASSLAQLESAIGQMPAAVGLLERTQFWVGALGFAMNWVLPFITASLQADQARTEALRNLHAGAEIVIPVIRAQLASEDAFVTERCTALEAKREELNTAIAAQDPAGLAAMSAVVEAERSRLSSATPRGNSLLTALMETWVREHAATDDRAAADVDQEQWAGQRRHYFGGYDGFLSDAEGGRSMGARLFIDQCRREWRRRGLAVDDGAARLERLCEEAYVHGTVGGVSPADAYQDAGDGLELEPDAVRDGFRSLARGQGAVGGSWAFLERQIESGSLRLRLDLESNGDVCRLDAIWYFVGTGMEYTVQEDLG
jgi:hypothetical protein